MTDRDRLIELLVNFRKPDNPITQMAERMIIERIADYLLANGVIVPTFNCGDRVWFIPIGLKLNEVCEATVIGIEYNYFTSPQEWVTLEYYSSIIGKHEYKSRIDLMLNKTVFLTKDEAEQALKERNNQ
ncbi:MAG: hypothetical protein U0L72_00745 [Acutalibacteraceae bacterium]|nr:hypothetical protein [Acutalibacteraceae bacterium]